MPLQIPADYVPTTNQDGDGAGRWVERQRATFGLHTHAGAFARNFRVFVARNAKTEGRSPCCPPGNRCAASVLSARASFAGRDGGAAAGGVRLDGFATRRGRDSFCVVRRDYRRGALAFALLCAHRLTRPCCGPGQEASVAGQRMLFCLGLTCTSNVTVEKECGAEVSASSATEHGV